MLANEEKPKLNKAQLSLTRKKNISSHIQTLEFFESLIDGIEQKRRKDENKVADAEVDVSQIHSTIQDEYHSGYVVTNTFFERHKYTCLFVLKGQYRINYLLLPCILSPLL